MQFFVVIIRVVIHKLVEKKKLVCSTIWFGSDYLADLSKCFLNDHCFSLHCQMSSKGPAYADGAVI